MKRKIGILVPVDKVRDRTHYKEAHFDKLKYFGFRRIIDDIDLSENEILFISPEQMSEVDFVLYSLTSYYEIFNLVQIFRTNPKGKAKIIIGGAGCKNIYLLKDDIDYACFGRGENQINDVLNGKTPPNYWVKEKDPDLKNRYQIRELDEYIDQGSTKEKATGCQKKCLFCQYSWTNKFKISDEENKKYESAGFFAGTTEDFFLNFDWAKSSSRIITALDGSTELTRKIIGKSVSNSEIVDKLLSIDDHDLDGKRGFIKTYNIVGYPWEDERIAELTELKEAILEAQDRVKTKNRAIILLVNNHFIPMSMTPLAFEKFNFINFRDEFLKFRSNKILNLPNFQLTIFPQMRTPVLPFENTFAERAKPEDKKYFKFFTSKEYQKAAIWKKLAMVKKYIPSRFYDQLDLNENLLIPYLEMPYDYLKAAEKFRANAEKYKLYENSGLRAA